MKSIKRPDQYLRLRQDIWHYVRRVPKAVQHVETRTLIYKSLDTDSRKVARQRRDICAAADDQRWHQIAPSAFENSHHPDAIIKDLHQHARSFGYAYVPAKDSSGPSTAFQRPSYPRQFSKQNGSGDSPKLKKMWR